MTATRTRERLAEALGADRRPAPREAWGDFLISRADPGPSKPGRLDGPGRAVRSSGDWTLRSQAPGPGWCGYPLTATETGPWQLWIVGELYGGANARAVAADVAMGNVSASALNGHLLLLGWNESERQWHVWTDRFGTVHAYYASDGSRSSLGTCFSAVSRAASQRRLDWEALSGFFAFGFFPQDRTFFEDVRILRPSSHYVFDGDGKVRKSERYAAWSHRPDTRRSPQDTVEAFASVLHTILDEESASSERMALPISGGLDSRTTVAALTRPGRKPGARLWSYSYGYTDDSVETRIARRVAEARSLPFHALTVGPYLFDELEHVLACVEGFQDVTQARQAMVANLLAEKSDVVMAAHWGDVWLDDMGLVGARPSEDAVIDHALAKISKRGRAWLLRHVIAPRLGAEPERRLREMVADELGRFPGVEDPDFRIKAFKTDQWSFRWTLASLRMYQAGAFPRLPFYDSRMADFFATVPSHQVSRRSLQIEYLKRHAPDLARITWQAYQTNLYRAAHFDTWLLPARAVKKAVRLLSARRDPERNWEVQFLNEDGRRRLREHLTSPGRKLHELVSRDEVTTLLDAFLASPLEENRGYTVSMLLTFSAWLEKNG
jgi:asparagine synthase (glutamine-hydrolysing)